MKKIKVDLKDADYQILICYNKFHGLGAILKKLKVGDLAVVVTNRRIKKLLGSKIKLALENAGLGVKFELVPDTETAKSVTQAIKTINRISKYDINKKVFLIGLGGGVVGDLTGFVAATYKRGIPYIQIPTTLLAQVDSAIGGKTAVDLSFAKNIIGAFYQPRLVFSDILALRSLSARQICNGLAEVVKYGVILDEKLFCYIEKNYKKILKKDAVKLEYIVHKSSKLKTGIVSADEKETRGLRTILNYGHTIGHAIEAAVGYSERISHGEAVSVGMYAAACLSNKLGILDDKTLDRIRNLLFKIGLPTKLEGSISIKKILSCLAYDKKFIHGEKRFVLPTRIGHAIVCEGISDGLIKDVLERIHYA